MASRADGLIGGGAGAVGTELFRIQPGLAEAIHLPRLAQEATCSAVLRTFTLVVSQV